MPPLALAVYNTIHAYFLSVMLHVYVIHIDRTVASEIQTADCPVCAVTISMVRTHCPNSPLPSSCACIEIVHNMLSCRFCGFCKAFTQCHGREG